MTLLAPALQRYFTDYAHAQRDLSPNTIAAYRDTWRMLIKHVTATTSLPADKIGLDMLDAQVVAEFLDHLQAQRGNSAKTRNARLTGIRAVLAHALPDHPEHAETITRVLAIPTRRSAGTGTAIPHRRGNRRAARRPRHGNLDRAARPRPAHPRRPDRAANQRADRPHHRRHLSRHRAARDLPRQRPTTPGHATDADHRGRADGLPHRTAAHAAGLPCSPDLPASTCPATPSNTGLPSTSRSPPEPARRWQPSTSPCTACGTRRR